jgi:hypothetical protein
VHAHVDLARQDHVRVVPSRLTAWLQMSTTTCPLPHGHPVDYGHPRTMERR